MISLPRRQAFAHMTFEKPDISAYQYPLPGERIAKFPLEERDLSKLLVWKRGKVMHDRFKNLIAHLPKHALMVFNDTKVIPARIPFRRKTGANIEIFLLEPVRPSPEAEQVMKCTDTCTWRCLVGNKKKWKDGEILEKTITAASGAFSVRAILESRADNEVRFTWDRGPEFAEVIERAGLTPIPPYLNRKASASDRKRYQTIYSKRAGAVAAPTAGLHFTPRILKDLKKKDIRSEFITLHVSAGTFKPVKTRDYREHPMHAEQVTFTRDNIRALLRNETDLIAVGTTSMRSLESLYWFGVKLMTGNDETFHIEKLFPYAFSKTALPSKKEVFGYLLNYMDRQGLKKLQGETEIFIFPGYNFRVCDGLVTNFHMPGSTLLLLVAAFTNGDWKQIYQAALDHDYRFLSYGDSSLLFR